MGGNDMKLGKLLQPELLTPIIFFLFMVGSIFFLFQIGGTKEQVVTNWSMDVVGLSELYRTGEAVELHLFLEDEQGHPIEDANVTLMLDRPETVHHLEKVMHHVEGGLFETEAIFSLPGTWIGMVEASRGRHVYRNQFFLTVDGAIIADTSRDPSDHFTLDQPLPEFLKKEMEAMSTPNP
jgi:hypothetical protein